MAELVKIIIEAEDRASAAFSGLQSTVSTGLLGAAAIGGAAIAGIATIAAATAVASAREFVGFQNSMNEVFTLLPGMSDEAMGEMRGHVLEFSKEMAVLPEKVVPALYQAISAGVPQDNVFSFLEIAQKAAVGGVTELETAVDGISSVINAYGTDVLSAAEASDLMFTAVRLGKTDFGQLSASLFNVIPTASALGVEFGDVTAGLAALTAQGVPTSVATTQMRQLFLELSKAGSGAANIFEEAAGKSFKDFIAAGGNTAEALDIMLWAANGLDVGVNDLFSSVEAGSAALALAGSQTFVDNIAEMADAVGATDEAYETMNGGIARSIERFQAFKSATLITIGDALSPFLDIIVDLAEKVLPKIEGVLNGLVIPAIEKLGHFAEILFAGLDGGISPLEALENALLAAFGEEIAGKVMGVVESVQQFMDKLWEFVDAAQEVLQPVIDFIAENVKLQDVMIALGIVVASVIIPALLSIAATMLPIIAVAVAVIAIVALLRTAWENDWGGIQGKTQAVVSWIKEFVENTMAAVRAFWEANGEAIKAKAQEIWDAIGEAISTAVEWIKTTVDTIMTAVKAFWEENGDAILAKAQEIWDFILGHIENTMELIRKAGEVFAALFKGDWELLGQKLVEFWEQAWTTIKDFLVGFWDLIKPVLETLWESIKTWWNGIDWASLGRSIIDGIVSAITGGAGRITGAISGIISGIQGAIGGVIPGFQTGGFTGFLPETAIAGFVHGNEYVFSAPAVRRIGVGNLEAMHRGQSAGGGGNGGNITFASGSIAVYAAPGMDERRLAERVVEAVNRKLGSQADSRMR